MSVIAGCYKTWICNSKYPAGLYSVSGSYSIAPACINYGDIPSGTEIGTSGFPSAADYRLY
jgi:hypothetical protein